jgi:3-oxoadipate enol-lactonase
MTAVRHVVEGPSDGSTVVLAGSLGSTLAMWEPQVPALTAAGYRVVRYDARGHGASPVPPGPYSMDDLADDAVELLDLLGVERAHFVGLSVGGMAGLRLAARNPERVDRLAVMCTSAYTTPKGAFAERAALVSAEGTAGIAPTVVGRWFTENFKAAHPDDLAAFIATLSASPREGYVATCLAIEGMDLRADLTSITAPTLVIGGADDQSIPPPHQEAIAAAIPGARLVILEHAAHLASFERADEVNALLLDHLSDDGGSDG